ncbi:hypothetical protein L9F63_008498, partial [Diploptera punctata]
FWLSELKHPLIPLHCFGHRSSSILKTCPNHFNSFSSILSIMHSSASIMFLISLFVT